MKHQTNNSPYGRTLLTSVYARLGLPTLLGALIVMAFQSVDLRAHASQQNVVGYIERTSHSLSDGYSILRSVNGGRESVPLSNYTTVYVGDHIVVSEVGHWVQLQHLDKGLLRIERGNSPLKLEDPIRERTPFRNLLADYWDKANSWIKELRAPDLETAINTTASTRGQPGGELRSELLHSSADLRLVAGERFFALDWDGGKAPFELEIYVGAEAEPVGAWIDIEDREIEGAAVNFAPGNHTIVLRDSEGAVVETDLIAVPSSNMPQSPLDVPSDASSTPIAELMSAVWLADKDKSWALEAYLQAKGLAQTYPPAVVLADKLVKGQRLLP